MVMYKIRGRKARLGKDSSIAATEAAKTFGRLVNRVREEQATYVIERGGTPVAQIGPVETRRATMRDFVAFVRERPPLSPVSKAYVRAVEEGMAAVNTPRIPKNPWGR